MLPGNSSSRLRQEPVQTVADDARANTGALPAHRYALADGWSSWRQSCLRSAGFPVAPLTELRAPRSCARLEIVIRCHAALEAARKRGLDACCRHSPASDIQDKRRWRRRRRALKRARPVIPEASDDPVFAARCREVRAALAELDSAIARFESTFTAEEQQRTTRIIDLTLEPRFREALAWQNRALLNRIGVLSFRDSKRSVRNGLALALLHYWYRYRTKNESIGFFGPVAWTALVTDGDGVAHAPGPELVAHRDMQFEYWALDRVCATFAQWPGVRAWLKPRWSRRCRIDGDDFVKEAGARAPLRGLAGAILRLCSGTMTAHAIATQLQHSGATTDLAQTYRVLDELVSVGTIDWAFTIPVTHAPQEYVAAQVAEIGDADLRQRLDAAWRELTSGLDRIRAVPDSNGGRDPERLNRVLDELDATFTGLTGAAPQRNPGRTYGGRALTYEDCRRDVDVTLGAPLLETVATPLSLLGVSARWFTYAIANTFARTITPQVLNHLHEQRVTQTPLAPFINAMVRLAHRIAARHTVELQAKWAAILTWPSTAHRVRRSATVLGDQIRETFAAPHPGWPGARFHTPDLMLYRRSDGTWQWVLGEFHAAMNTALHRSMLSVHPDPAAMRACYTRDKARVEFSFVPSRNFGGGHRIAGGTVDADDDITIALDATPSARPPGQCVDVACLQFVEVGGEIRILDTRDGTCRPLAAILQAVCKLAVMNGFQPIAASAHTPRIYFDNLIMRRESWQVAAAEIPFLDGGSAAHRFRAAREWQLALHLPREVFIRAPREMKPVYVDFTAPVTLDIARRILKHERAAGNKVILSEMLPGTRQPWLTDAGGGRYTSELRMPLVDPLAYPAY